MRDKQLNKKVLDKLLRYTRSFWNHTAKDIDAILEARMEAAKQLVGGSWIAIIDLLDAIFEVRGFHKNTSNESVYDVLRMLGWDVVEMVGEE